MSKIKIAFIIGALVMIGAAFGTLTTKLHYQKLALEHGCAAYDATTGEWGWKSDRN